MKRPKKLVIKIGTSVLTKDGIFTKSVINKLAGELSELLNAGMKVSIVSSGAIGAGMSLLDRKTRPKTMEELQALAAIGQRYLMQCWEEAFSKYELSTAQMLLTRDDLANDKRAQNAKKTLYEIQNLEHVPIINENDTVATEEIKFGDNDHLSALLAKLIHADRLVIYSDTNGLFDNNGKQLPKVSANDDSIYSYVRDKKTHFTVGGMKSKLKAIRDCTDSGISVTLTSATTSIRLYTVIEKNNSGTFFEAKGSK